MHETDRVELVRCLEDEGKDSEAILLDLLAARDAAIGAEAEVAELRFRLEQLEKQQQAMMASMTVRIGTAVLAPVRGVRRLRRRARL